MRRFTSKISSILLILSSLAAFLLIIAMKAGLISFHFNADSLHLIILVIVIITVIGTLSLRLIVMPLMRRVIQTERDLIKSNKLLQESQERFDLAVTGSQFGVWDWQVGTSKIFYSHLTKKMLGYTEEELPNTTTAFQRILHPDDVAKAQKAIYEHIKNHVPYNIEYRLKTKSGQYLWFQTMGQAMWDENGRAFRMAGSIMDITDRKLSQQRQAAQYVVTQLLSEATSLQEVAPKILRAICEGMSWDFGAIWMADAQAGVLQCEGLWGRPDPKLEALKEQCRQLKLNSGVGLPGKIWSSGEAQWFTDPSDMKHFPRIAALKEAGLHSGFGFPILLGFNVLGCIEFFTSGKSLPNEYVLKMMEAIGPQVGQFILRTVVESERKRIEELKNEFVSVVSHELRTPLTSIRGALGLLAGGAVGDFTDKAKQLLKIANGNCERLLLLINDILDVEKIEAGKMNYHFKPYNVDKLVSSAVDANQLYAEKFSVKLNIIEKAPHIRVNVDPDRFMQVMNNLISNAVKFSPKDGCVDIGVRAYDGYVRISVSDTGPGIPEEFKTRIFQKFSQADTSTTREKGGTGLGLSISKMIVERFHGVLSFISRPNVKTEFFFDLPKWDAEK